MQVANTLALNSELRGENKRQVGRVPRTTTAMWLQLTTLTAVLAAAVVQAAPPPEKIHADRAETSERRLVGIAYSTWFTSTEWRNTWGTPTLEVLPVS